MEEHDKDSQQSSEVISQVDNLPDTEQDSPQSPFDKKSKKFPVLLFLGACILFFIGVYVFGMIVQSYLAPQRKEMIPSDTKNASLPTSQSASSPLPHVSSLDQEIPQVVHVDDQLGFKINYPQTLSGGAVIREYPLENGFSIGVPIGWGMSVIVYENKTAEDEFSNLKYMFERGGGSATMSATIFKDYDAYEVHFSTDTGDGSIILIERDNNVYEIEGDRDLESISEIISSFELI